MPYPSPKRDAAIAELRRNPHRSNHEIAAVAGCSWHTVRAARSALLQDAVIPRRSAHGFTAQIRALWPTWTGTQRELARHLGCSDQLVHLVTRRMRDEATLEWKTQQRNNDDG